MVGDPAAHVNLMHLGGCNHCCCLWFQTVEAVFAPCCTCTCLLQTITMPSVPGMMGGGRKAARKDDVRLAHAHLTRMLANNLPPGSLADNVVGGCGGGRVGARGGCGFADACRSACNQPA